MDGKDVTVGTILILFIGIIVALAILPEIATQGGIMTTKSNVINETVDLSTAWTENGYNANTSETFTLANAPSGWKITGCPLTTFTFANASKYFTVTTDYSLAASTGVLTLVPTAEINRSGNTTYATYIHCRDGYLTDSGQRSVAGLILIFAALGLLGFTIYYVIRKYF